MSRQNISTQLWTRLGELSLFLVSLSLFILAIQLTVEAFYLTGTQAAQDLVNIATNPFTALFIGLLATALVQSSSTTTSLIVSIVAAGGLTVEAAVPMILGANVGTAITSTIVALGHIGNKNEFEKAVAGAALHDFFNIISVTVMFALELTTGFLSGTALFLSEKISTLGTLSLFTLLSPFHEISHLILGLVQGVPVVGILLGLIALFASLRLFIWVMRKILIGQLADNLNRYLFSSPFVALSSGFISTSILQSSSVTTSLMVPLIATEKVSLSRAFPFFMGANVGTTLTALLAALFTGGEDSNAALAVAFTHLFLNLAGVLLLYPVSRIRNWPVTLAGRLGKLTLKNRVYGVIYIVGLFFILPFLLILISEGATWLP